MTDNRPICFPLSRKRGPIIGVIVFYLLQTYLAGFGSWYLFLLGGLAIATMLFAPKGIWGHVSQRFGIVCSRCSGASRRLPTSAASGGAAALDTKLCSPL